MDYEYICGYCDGIIEFLSAGDEGWHICPECGAIEGDISERSIDED
jgi:hypothetical protein